MADQNELIIAGARQNNLKNISLRIPHDQVTANPTIKDCKEPSLFRICPRSEREELAEAGRKPGRDSGQRIAFFCGVHSLRPVSGLPSEARE